MLALRSARVMAGNGMEDAAVVVEKVGEAALLAFEIALVLDATDSFLGRLVGVNIVAYLR